MRLDFIKCIINLSGGGNVKGKNKELGGCILLAVGGELFRPPERGDNTLVRGEDCIEQSSAYALRRASNYEDNWISYKRP